MANALTSEQLDIIISAQTAQFNKEIAKVNKQIDSINNTVNKASTGMSKSFAAVGKAIAAVVSVGAILKFGKDILDTADNLKTMSAQTGLSVERIQELEYIVGQTGGSIDLLKRGIQTMNEAIASGSPELAKLGITTTNAGEAFDQVINKLADMGDTAERNALGQKLLGRSFVELKPMLAEGSAGLAEMSKAARESGIVMSSDLVNNVDRFGDSLKTLATMFKSIFYPVIEALMPVFQQLVSWLTTAAGFIRGVMEALFGLKSASDAVAGSSNQNTQTQVSNANKIKRAYAGFDELITVPETQTTSSIDTSGLEGFDTSGLSKDIDNAKKQLEGFNQAIQDGKKFWEDYGGAITAATAAITLFWAAWAVGPTLMVWWKGIVSVLETAFINLLYWFDDISAALYVMGSQGEASGSLLLTVLDKIVVAFGTLTAPVIAIIVVILAVIAALIQLFTEANARGEAFRDSFVGTFQVIGGWIATFSLGFNEAFKEFKPVLDQALGWLADFWDGFVSLIGGVVRFIMEVINFVLLIFTPLFPVIGFLLGLFVDIGVAVLWVIGLVAKIFGVVFEAVGNVLNWIADQLASWRKDFDKNIKGISTIWNTVMDSIKSGWDGFWGNIDKMLNPIRSFFNSIIKFWNNSIGKFKVDIPGWVPFIGGQTWGFPTFKELPMAANGGIFDAGQAFIAGEAGMEMIGNYNGKTTVMPLENTSFTAAMGEAVFNAMTNAMANQGNGQVIIQVDGMTLAKSVESNLNKLSTVQGGLKIAL